MAWRWPANEGRTVREQNKKEKQMSDSESSAPLDSTPAATLTGAQLQNLLATVITEARKPYIDKAAEELNT